MKKKIFIFLFLILISLEVINTLKADTPVQEEGGSQLMQYQQKVQQYSDQNETVNEQREKIDIKENEMKAAVNNIAQQMGKIENLAEYIKKLLGGDGSSLDINNNGEYEEGFQESVKLVQFDPEYSVLDGKILVNEVITKPPTWMVTNGQDSTQTANNFYSSRTKNLLIKVAAHLRAKLKKDMRSSRLELMAYGMAKNLLPDKLLTEFNAARTISYLLGKAGIIELSDGIIARPTAPQDTAFVKYANLDSDETKTMLFWSDPSIAKGYHPLFGVALNQTSLKGYKDVDMDNAVSRGYSRKIDKYNLLQPPEKRMANPFKGYASRVVPGLIVMVERGQIKDGEMPTDKQLSAAMKLTSQLRMLPSQNIKLKKNVSFRFRYPPRVILVQSDASTAADTTASGSEDQTGVVNLPELNKNIYEKSMLLAEKRLREINKLKDEIAKGRKYVSGVLDTLNQMAQELDTISQNMVKTFVDCMPQITQLRKQIFDSMEQSRWTLAKMEDQYDDLLHREWIILHHVLETRDKSIYELMNDAAIRWRTVQQNTDVETTSSEGDSAL